MADQAVPAQGNSRLTDKFGAAVADVHKVEDARTIEALEKGRSADGENTLSGGLMNRVVFNKAAEDKKNKDRDAESMLIQTLLSDINWHMSQAELYLEKAEEHLRNRDEIEERLFKDENGETDWNQYAEMYLTEEEINTANRDVNVIIQMLESKLLDDNGHPVVEDDVAYWMAETKAAREDLSVSQHHRQVVRQKIGPLQAQDENYELDTSDYDDRAESVADSIAGDLDLDGADVVKPDDDLLADMGFDMDF